MRLHIGDNMYVDKKISKYLLFIIAFWTPNVAIAGTMPDTHSVVIEARGKLPGLKHDELVDYLARKTQEATGAPWHFTGGKDGTPSAPNRIVWSFKVLRRTWGIGGHGAHLPVPYSETYIGAEVKFYLDDAYQMSLLTEETIYHRSDDEALSKMVGTVSRALFAENRN